MAILLCLCRKMAMKSQQSLNNSFSPVRINHPIKYGRYRSMPRVMSFLKCLDTAHLTVTTENPTPIRLNVGDSAHFISQYDEPLFMQLLEQVKSLELNPLDRLQLLHEQTLLARAGNISSSELIPLLHAYEQETTEAVWDIMSLALVSLKSLSKPMK